MGDPVVFVEIPTTDVEGAVAFYGAVFDWELTEVVPGEFWRVGTGRRPNLGIMRSDTVGSGPMTRVYLQCDDPTATVARAVAAGGHELWAERPLLDLGRSAAFTDPFGVEVVAWRWNPGRGGAWPADG
ncbi:MAG TPA: VOC family protein [Acidimicrobiales bacterium]|nr:VOC family protein [Acidimicrobiales bacterium]